MNNLFISYDLKNPGQNYERVITAIKALGSWAKVQYSLWYVSTPYTAKQAADLVRRAQDSNDTLIAIDATNNDAAWYGLDQKVSDYLQQNWNKRTAGVSRY
jgi:hypothetical protein